MEEVFLIQSHATRIVPCADDIFADDTRRRYGCNYPDIVIGTGLTKFV